MNKYATDLLEKHFDTAFAAPEGIKKLRELILTLAMQGKLVPQDPNDPPASELLKEIEAEKQRLVKEGKIRKPKPLPPIKEKEKPYVLPRGWEWVRLQSFSDYNGRPNIDPGKIAKDAWLLDLEDIEKETSRLICRTKYYQRESKSTKSTFKKGDVLYGKLRPYLDKVLVADSVGVCTTEIVPIIPSKAVTSEFLRLLLKRPDFLAHVNALMYGVKMPRLGTEDAICSVHPIPPVNEQHRIVAKIDELMARCDELEKLRAAQREKCLTVHTATLKQLQNIAEPDQHQRALAFLAEHFGDLYSVKENVSELRKAILQLAVMGKLVPQNPNDQPASELLKEIDAEKLNLVKEGKIKNHKPLPPVTEEEKPYKLPQGWEWARLGDLISYMDAGWSPKCKNEPARENEWGVLKTTAVQALQFWPHQNKALPEKLVPRPDAQVAENDILITRAGPKNRVGVCCVAKTVRPKLMLSDKIIRFNIYGNLIFPDYCALVLNTGYGDDQIERMKSGMADSQMNISQDKVKQVIAALPPIPEQHRIVAKIDELMDLCDSLDQKIDAATCKQAELLTALIRAQLQGKTAEEPQPAYRA